MFRLACFRFAAGQAASPLVHDVNFVADARAVEGQALSVDEPSKLSKSVSDARAVEGPALSVDEPSELNSVAVARAVDGPALSVDEPSELSKSVADARAAEGLCFFRLACFRFAAGKAASPVVHDVKQSESVADVRAVEGPA